MGTSILYLNGKRVGDHILDPGYTRYDRRVLYVTYDVTDMLNSGQNAVGIILGNGFYNVQNKAAWNFDQAPWRAAPKLLCQIEAELDDGSRVTIAGDSPGKRPTAPLFTTPSIAAKSTTPGWNNPAGTGPASTITHWSPALLVEPPKGILAAQMMPPIRADRELEPVKINETKPGVYVFDFGQNMAGNARLRLSGPAGTKVSMKYSELLAPDGNVDQKNIAVHVLAIRRRPDLPDRHLHSERPRRGNLALAVCLRRIPLRRGDRFSGPAGKKLRSPPIFFHTDVPEAGRFECSNPMLNRIWTNARWSYLSNLAGHSHRLPAPREKRLDRRRPSGRRASHVQLLSSRLLHEMDQ